MNKKLYTAGIVAIPLKNVESNLGILHPNFFVIESQFGKLKADCLNIQTGELENVFCIQINYKIVYREILLSTPVSSEQFIERVLLPLETLSIPVELLPVIFTQQEIKANIGIVNLCLSRFSFRGVLSELSLAIDEEVLDEIIYQQNLVEEPIQIYEGEETNP